MRARTNGQQADIGQVFLPHGRSHFRSGSAASRAQTDAAASTAGTPDRPPTSRGLEFCLAKFLTRQTGCCHRGRCPVCRVPDAGASLWRAISPGSETSAHRPSPVPRNTRRRRPFVIHGAAQRVVEFVRLTACAGRRPWPGASARRTARPPAVISLPHLGLIFGPGARSAAARPSAASEPASRGETLRCSARIVWPPRTGRAVRGRNPDLHRNDRRGGRPGRCCTRAAGRPAHRGTADHRPRARQQRPERRRRRRRGVRTPTARPRPRGGGLWPRGGRAIRCTMGVSACSATLASKRRPGRCIGSRMSASIVIRRSIRMPLVLIGFIATGCALGVAVVLFWR